MGWLRKRFGEGSTYKGMAILASIAGYLAGPEAIQAYSPMVGVAVGLYETMRAEAEPKS